MLFSVIKVFPAKFFVVIFFCMKNNPKNNKNLKLFTITGV